MPTQFPNSDPVTATPQPTPFDSLLAQCRDLVSERLSLALSGMLDKVDDALSALISETRDANVQKLYSQTRDKALAQREAIEKQFRARYLREFQQRSNRVKKIGDSFADIDLSSLELELVGEEDLDETIKFNALAARLRQYCDEELIALDQRVGVLIGDASLQTDDNPFTPQAICDAYKDTCRQLDSNVDVRMVLLRLFDDHVVDEIRAVYKAVNALLIQNSILPKIRLSARKEASKPPPSGAKAGGEAPKATARAEQKAPEGEQDLFSILKNLRANAMPQAGAAGGTGAPVAGAAGIAAGADGVQAVLQGTELLGLLTRIQLGDMSAVPGNIVPTANSAGEPGIANVLRGLKDTSVGAGMNQLDVLTLDIMSLVFDQLFDDPKIPVGVKGLIGRLQIPMLKVAIADKTFFSKKAHPARQLLDTLGEISLRLPVDFNASSPLFGRMEVILQELIDGFEADLEIFDAARERLETLITEEDKRVEQDTLSAANRIEQKERLALAKTVAQAEIKARVRTSNVPVPVLEFLIQQWVQVLLVVHVVDGEASDVWKNALETMDLLIWSVEPKHTLDERRELAVIVPEVRQRIAAGLKMVDIEDAVRSEFFAELRELHAGIIGKPEVDSAMTQDASRANDAAISDSASAMQPESAFAAELPPAPVAEPAVAPAPVPVAEPAAVPDAKIASVPDPEIAQAPAVEVVPVQVVEPATAPAFAPDLEFAPTPAAEVTGVPAVESATLPDPEPATAPASVPAAQPESASVAELLPGPVAEPEAHPVPVPDLDFAPAPAAEVAPAPIAEPAAIPVPMPDLDFSPPPAAQAAPVPVVESAATSVSTPDLEFTTAPTPQVTPAPAAEPAFLLDLEIIPAPAAQAAPAPAAQAVPASAAEFVSLPELKFTPAPAAQPAALPELNFAIEPAAQPAAAPAAKPTAAPAAQPAAALAAKSTAAPTARPAPTPAAQRVTAPPATKSAATPAAQPHPESTAKATAAPTAPAPAAQRVAAPSASKPAAVPAAQPAPAPSAKPGLAPGARSVSAPPAKPAPAPGKGVQPVARSPAAPQSQSETNASASLDFTAPITVQNPFGGGKVQVEDLDFTAKPAAGAAGAAGAKRDATPAQLPGNLAVGTWVGIREKSEKDTRRSAKLSYISPLKTRYLFVDRQGKTTLDCSRAELASRFQIGEIVIMDKVPEVPLFDRITEGLVGKLGGGKTPR